MLISFVVNFMAIDLKHWSSRLRTVDDGWWWYSERLMTLLVKWLVAVGFQLVEGLIPQDLPAWIHNQRTPCNMLYWNQASISISQYYLTINHHHITIIHCYKSSSLHNHYEPLWIFTVFAINQHCPLLTELETTDIKGLTIIIILMLLFSNQ